MSLQKKATLVFIPFPVVSHQTAAVELAKLLVDRDERLSITIIIMTLPVDTKTGSHSNNHNSHSRINFVELDKTDCGYAEWSKSPRSFVPHFIESQKGPVRDVVVKITSGPAQLAGFVLDMFCTTMIDVANDLGVPSYIFLTCGAATLGLISHLQDLSDEKNQDLSEYDNSDFALSIPTYVNPVPAKVWPAMIFEKENSFLNFFRRFKETKGIIINTFLEFEPHAVKALSDDEKFPTIYPVGPIIEIDHEKKEHEEIKTWLDNQPDSSVVYLCFGSRGCFEEDQVNEIAKALENSGQRFLWSLRKPPPKEKMDFPGEYESYGDVLPDGFLERTVGVGKVIGWAPQMAVLSHSAVGGFVSHCGWNSTLESVWCNVPIATWPLSAEQQANAFQLVKEFGIGVEIQMDYRKDSNVIVKAEKIEKAIRELMGMGNEGRAKVKVLNEKSRTVMKNGGSSYGFLGCFVEDVFNSVS
ncbi:hypothetical protein CASFOL_011391 [Castilleja foliolosa]|uniref:Glycosyltransferase n=1 Tax=Castilleja foliolosa TaxID=1961234 RepID=A0ABD3DZF8_9LAMI